MIKTKDLFFEYNAQQAFHFPDIDTSDGKPLLLLGPSGCGKTTLLHLLAGLLKLQKGKIVIDNTEINLLEGKKLDRFRGKNIGIIFQKATFIPALNVWDNVKLPQLLNDQVLNDDYIVSLLKSLNIYEKNQKKINQISQGEQQRCSIARALVNQPKVLLADEPTSSLDDDNCLAVVELLKTQAERVGTQLIIVTHDNRLTEIFEHQIRLNP